MPSLVQVHAIHVQRQGGATERNYSADARIQPGCILAIDGQSRHSLKMLNLLFQDMHQHSNSTSLQKPPRVQLIAANGTVDYKGERSFEWKQMKSTISPSTRILVSTHSSRGPQHFQLYAPKSKNDFLPLCTLAASPEGSFRHREKLSKQDLAVTTRAHWTIVFQNSMTQSWAR